MTREQKNNSGVLFKNDRKEAETHADYTGNALIDGKEFWINAWVKEGAKGKFFSFSFRPKAPREEPAPVERKTLELGVAEEIPF